MPSVSILREITQLMEREVAFTRKSFGRDFGAPAVPRCFLRLIEAWGGLRAFRSHTGCDLVLLPYPWAHPSKYKWWETFQELKTGEDMVFAWSREFPHMPSPHAWFWHQSFGLNGEDGIPYHFPLQELTESAEWVLSETIPIPSGPASYLQPEAMAKLLFEIGGKKVMRRVGIPFVADEPQQSIRRILQLVPKAVLQHWFYEKRSTGSVTAHLPSGWEALYLDFWREEHFHHHARDSRGVPSEGCTNDPSVAMPPNDTIWEWCSDVGTRISEHPLVPPSNERMAMVFGGCINGVGVHQSVPVTQTNPMIGWRLILRAVQ